MAFTLAPQHTSRTPSDSCPSPLKPDPLWSTESLDQAAPLSKGLYRFSMLYKPSKIWALPDCTLWFPHPDLWGFFQVPQCIKSLPPPQGVTPRGLCKRYSIWNLLPYVSLSFSFTECITICHGLFLKCLSSHCQAPHLRLQVPQRQRLHLFSSPLYARNQTHRRCSILIFDWVYCFNSLAHPL